MAGIIAVYSLVIAVLVAGDMSPPPEQQYALFSGFMHLAAGLSVGLTGLAAGYAIGTVGDMVIYPGEALDHDRAADGCAGSSIVHAAISNICRHGVDTNLRRGLGPLWVSRPCGSWASTFSPFP
jgi:hypothetical protein